MALKSQENELKDVTKAKKLPCCQQQAEVKLAKEIQISKVNLVDDSQLQNSSFELFQKPAIKM